MENERAGSLIEDEELGFRVLLWASDGNPEAATLFLSPTIPEGARRGMLTRLAQAARARPEWLAELPGPEVVAFFRPAEGEDPLEKFKALAAYRLGRQAAEQAQE